VQDQNDFDFPWRRWLLWGFLAIAALVAIVFFFIQLADDETGPAVENAEEGNGPQVTWSIVLTDQTGDTVTLKGDQPRGVATETWVDDEMIIRDPSGTFEWNMDLGLPAAVVDIDEAEGCDALNAKLDLWADEVGAATAEPQHWQARAFAQHSLDTIREQGCEFDEASLNAVLGGD